MICALMNRLTKLFMQNADIRNIRQILLARGIMHKIISAALEPNDSTAEKDFHYCAKEMVNSIIEYVNKNENDLTREIIDHCM